MTVEFARVFKPWSDFAWNMLRKRSHAGVLNLDVVPVLRPTFLIAVTYVMRQDFQRDTLPLFHARKGTRPLVINVALCACWLHVATFCR